MTLNNSSINKKKKLISEQTEKETSTKKPTSPGSPDKNNVKSRKNTKETPKKNEQEKPEESINQAPPPPNWTRKHLVNTYNNGIRRNFYEVFFYQDFNYKKFKK